MSTLSAATTIAAICGSVGPAAAAGAPGAALVAWSSARARPGMARERTAAVARLTALSCFRILSFTTSLPPHGLSGGELDEFVRHGRFSSPLTAYSYPIAGISLETK